MTELTIWKKEELDQLRKDLDSLNFPVDQKLKASTGL